MYRPVIITLLLLSLCSPDISGQVTGRVIVRGNHIFSNDDYLQWGGLSEGAPVTASRLDTVKKNIALQLFSRGYIHARLDKSYIDSSGAEQSDKNRKWDFVISVDEGRPALIRNISIKAGSDSTLFEKERSELQNTVFDRTAVERLIAGMLDHYEENGHPFASVKLSSVIFQTDSLRKENPPAYADVFISVDTGRTGRIDRIEFRGNSRTRDYVILRETGLRAGMMYSQKMIESIPARINRLRYFEPVAVPEFYFTSSGQGILAITLKERQTNNFDGILGYVPSRSERESGYITGMVNISMRNLLGTGRNAAVSWQKIDRNSQELDLKYLEPWLFGYPFNISLGLYQLKQDTTYVTRTYSSGVEFMASGTVSAAVSLSFQEVIPAISPYGLIPGIYNSTLTTTGFNLRIDTRDDYYSPRRGYYFLNSYYFSRKNIKGPKELTSSLDNKEINLQRLELDFGLYREFFRRQVAALQLHARELRGSLIEVSDLYRLGGMRTLRGYIENQFLANRLLWSNAEYRFLLSQRSYVFLFFDAGYYLKNEDKKRGIAENKAIKTGYGFGMNIETNLGILSVSYALAKGDPLNEGKVHFGFVGEF